MSGSPSLPPEALQQIYRQAREEFPKECCGYVIGRGEQAQVLACRNRQDQLHALDPQAHPRTAENGYNIGGKELLQLSRSFESDQPASIVYHSHPRVGAYFSDEDTRAALASGWPVDYLVVDVQDDGVREAILFRRQGEQYVEIERYPGE